MATIILDDAEHATVLAALRCWQRVGLLTEGIPPEWDIATSSGSLTPLKAGQVDALCERINTSLEPTPKPAPTRRFTKGAWSFKPGVNGMDGSTIWHVYAKGARAFNDIKATLYPASDGKCFVASATNRKIDARPSFDGAVDLVLEWLGRREDA